MKISRWLVVLAAMMAVTAGVADAQRGRAPLPGGRGPGYHAPAPVPNIDLGRSTTGSVYGDDGNYQTAAPLTPEQRLERAEQTWASRNRYQSQFIEGVTIGSRTSEGNLALVEAALRSPLPARPALIVLLHPDANQPDIRRLREAGSANIAVLDDPEHIEQFVSRSLSRFRGRPIFYVGHMSGHRSDAQIAVVDREGATVATMSSFRLEEMAKSRRSRSFMLACNSAEGGAVIGSSTPLEPVQITSALPRVMAARTYADLLAALAQTGIRIAVSADEFFSHAPEIHIYNLDDFSRHEYPEPIGILSVPPRELPPIFRAALPMGCANDAADEKGAYVSCDDYRGMTSILRFWPWVVGGFFALMVALWIIGAIMTFIDNLRYRWRHR